MIGLWGFRWLRFFLNPYQKDEFEHISVCAYMTAAYSAFLKLLTFKQEEERREYILGRLESAKFPEWSWVAVVAGVGFFTDAYSIFSINMVTPMLGIVYWQGTMPHSYEIALSAITLGGSIVGQILF